MSNKISIELGTTIEGTVKQLSILPLEADVPNPNILLHGTSGSGRTTCLSNILKLLSNHQCPVLVLDLVGDSRWFYPHIQGPSVGRLQLSSTLVIDPFKENVYELDSILERVLDLIPSQKMLLQSILQTVDHEQGAPLLSVILEQLQTISETTLPDKQAQLVQEALLYKIRGMRIEPNAEAVDIPFPQEGVTILDFSTLPSETRIVIAEGLLLKLLNQCRNSESEEGFRFILCIHAPGLLLHHDSAALTQWVRESIPLSVPLLLSEQYYASLNKIVVESCATILAFGTNDPRAQQKLGQLIGLNQRDYIQFHSLQPGECFAKIGSQPPVRITIPTPQDP